MKAGQLRLLAVTAPERLPGVDAPTLKESGVDVVLQNWRMVAAAPGITDEQRAQITADVKAMTTSAQWQEVLKTKGWQDTYLEGEAFEAELAKNIADTKTVLTDIGLVQ